MARVLLGRIWYRYVNVYLSFDSGTLTKLYVWVGFLFVGLWYVKLGLVLVRYTYFAGLVSTPIA